MASYEHFTQICSADDILSSAGPPPLLPTPLAAIFLMAPLGARDRLAADHTLEPGALFRSGFRRQAVEVVVQALPITEYPPPVPQVRQALAALLAPSGFMQRQHGRLVIAELCRFAQTLLQKRLPGREGRNFWPHCSHGCSGCFADQAAYQARTRAFIASRSWSREIAAWWFFAQMDEQYL